MNRKPKPGLMQQIKGFMLKHMHSMITCREFEDFIVAHLEGTLTPAQARRFNWHLRICRECREYLAAYRTAMQVGRGVLGGSDEPVPEDVPEDLVKAVLDSRYRR